MYVPISYMKLRYILVNISYIHFCNIFVFSFPRYHISETTHFCHHDCPMSMREYPNFLKKKNTKMNLEFEYDLIRLEYKYFLNFSSHFSRYLFFQKVFVTN